jgi:hypothetical protein
LDKKYTSWCRNVKRWIDATKNRVLEDMEKMKRSRSVMKLEKKLSLTSASILSSFYWSRHATINVNYYYLMKRLLT